MARTGLGARKNPVKLRSTAGTGYTYITRKNRRNDPDRLTLRKYDPVLRRRVEFREER
jgi:large subunit ribosomal protein L33